MDHIRRWLGIAELEKRVEEVEGRLHGVEDRLQGVEGVVGGALQGFGRYKSRSADELKLMRTQLDSFEASLELLIQDRENQRDVERAKRLQRLQRRIRNNQTRIDNVRKAIQS